MNELNYPAITVCSEVSTKYAIVEQLGNYFDTEKLIYEMKSQHKKKVQNLNCIITAKLAVNALLQMGL